MNAIFVGARVPGRPAVALLVTCLWVGISAPPLWADGPDVDGSLDYTELSLADLIEFYVVSGASRYEQKTSEAPASVTVVTAEEIAAYGHRTLAEVLQSVGGFYVTNDRSYDYAGVRGFSRPGDYNSRILLLVDGQRFNDNIYSSAGIGTDFSLDVDLIKKVEIVRGASSSLYGTNAFLGVVNVITKSGRDLYGLETAAAYSSFDSFRGRVSYGQRSEQGPEFLVSGTLGNTDGQNLYFAEFDDPDLNGGVFEGGDFDRNRSLFVKAAHGEFEFRGSYAQRDKGIPTAAWETYFNDPRTKTFDALTDLDLLHRRTLGKNAEFSTRLFYGHYYYDGDYAYDWADEGDEPFLVVNRDEASGSWFGIEMQHSRTVGRNRLMAGFTHQWNLEQTQLNFDVDPHESYLESDRRSQEWALFVQDEFRVRDGLILSGGLRHDYYSSFGGTTNPRLAVISELRPGSVLKLVYGTAFRAPSAYEQYYHDGEESQRANPDLEPETIASYELIWEQQLPRGLRATATVFHYDINGLISQAIDPDTDLLIFENLDKVDSNGIELTLAGPVHAGIKGRASYSYQRVRDLTNRGDVSNSPQHVAKLNLTLPLDRRGSSVGLEQSFTGRRETLAGNDVAAYFLTNLTVVKRLAITGFEISGSVYNLFGETYGDPGSGEHVQDVIERDGRTFRLKIGYSL